MECLVRIFSQSAIQIINYNLLFSLIQTHLKLLIKFKFKMAQKSITFSHFLGYVQGPPP